MLNNLLSIRRGFSAYVLFAALLLLLLTGGVHAQDDQTIYSGGWKNGWEGEPQGHYSWAKVQTVPGTVTGGSTVPNVLAVTIEEPYQALYLHHAPFPTHFYNRLSFQIHGGPNGGQSLRIVARLSEVGQREYAIGPLPKNAWQQVTISLETLGANGKPDLDGVLIQDGSGRAQDTFYVNNVRLLSGPRPGAVRLSADARRSGRMVDDRLFGMNTATWDSDLDTAETARYLGSDAVAGMDMRLLRFPGGSTADNYHWQTNTWTRNGQQYQGVSFDRFAQMVKSLKATGMVTVNYGSGTAQEAADWVAEAKKKGYPIRYWEIGNEVYGREWETDLHTTPPDQPHHPETYARYAADYMRLMREADSSIKVGVVMAHGSDYDRWNERVLTSLRSKGMVPDFVVQHYYPQAPGLEGDASLLLTSSVRSSGTLLRSQLQQYLGADGNNVEMLLTELNSVYGVPGKQTTSLTNALFLADTVGQLLTTEYSGLCWWALHDTRITAESPGNPKPNLDEELYGWRLYGDFGILGKDDAGVTAIHPVYYAFRLLRSFGRGGDTVIEAVSGHPSLAAYAVRRQSGGVSLLVINKNKLQPVVGEMTIGGLTVRSGTALTYGPTQDSAVRSRVPPSRRRSPGPASSPVFVWGRKAYYTFPAYSVTVINLNGKVVR